MKFDTIVIGGGLSGLISGIESARAGRRTAIVSTGQSALHFWSGSFDFLSHPAGRHIIANPLEHAGKLPDSHPYKKIGIKKTETLLERVPGILADAGIQSQGTLQRNHIRITPMGFQKPTWLTLDDYFFFNDRKEVEGKKAAIINIYSYIDFYPRFLDAGLHKLGMECTLADVNIPQLDILRKSTTEMRATNMSRFLNDAAIDDLAREIEKASKGADMVIMPAIVGIFSDAPVKRLRAALTKPVYFIATTPASVPGVRCQLSLRDLFTRLGGTYMPGDTAIKGRFEKNRLLEIYTQNFGDMPLHADNFVICTGSFFGHGLIAELNRIYEPIFGLDLVAGENRTEWYEKDLYAPQPYMTYGVKTDSDFRPSRKEETVENLYATGALLSGFNALKEGSGAGITLVSALHAAEKICQ